MSAALQLQFWDPATRLYAPSDYAPELARSVACGRSWRVCRADRPLRPRYTVHHYNGFSRSIIEMQVAYMCWAAEKGLRSVTVFRSHRQPNFSGFRGTINYVDAKEYFAVHHELS